MERALVTIALLLAKTIISVDPNPDMGCIKGDRFNSVGNYSRTKALLFKIWLFFLAMFSTVFRLGDPLNWTDRVAVGVALSGLCFSYWAYFTLGRFYTFTLGTRDKHVLIRSGPYAYMAHPGYFGQFLLICSVQYVFRVYYPLSCCLFMVTVFQFYERVCDEEKMMRDTFGVEYDAYLVPRSRYSFFVLENFLFV